MKFIDIYKVRAIILLFLLFSIIDSCKKSFLQQVPTDVIPTVAFYKTAEDLTGAVNGAYAYQRSIYSNYFLYNIEEIRSDNTSNKLGAQAEQRAADNFQADQGNYIFGNDWAESYTCINLCNAIINRGPSINMDNTLRDRLIGEAKFIRAQTYFCLVQDYGGVPLRLTESTSLSGDNTLARASVPDVYNSIVGDLVFAATALPKNYTGSDVGRATSGAALGLLGKAYLQEGKKDSAAFYLQQVVRSNEYQLLPKYADLWAPANKNTAESLFELQYFPPKDGSPFWNNQATPAVPTNLVPGGTNTAFPSVPTQDLLDAYEPGDLRFPASVAFDVNGRPYSIKFRDTTELTGGQARNNFPILRYSDILLSLAEALGESTQAYALINQVRERAGLSDISAATPGTFFDKIQHERQVEFAFECQRWHDLLRLPSSQAISIMNADLARDLTGQNISIDQHDLLCPIPVTETQTNSLVVQNPGY